MGRETVFILLFVFGCFFNWVTAKAIEREYTEGYLWLLVAIGDGVTIGGLWYLFPDIGPWILLGFACSGVPMTFGAIWRYISKRDRGKRDIRKGT